MQQNTDDLCEMIIRKYYTQIYRYCFSKLQFNEQAAQDCTQDTFMIMIQKKNRLTLSGNMRVWLYKTADHVIRNYLRKERRHMENLPLDDTIPIDNAEILALTADSPLDCLTEREKAILTAYYTAEHGHRETVAAQYNMTLDQLYREIERLKKKLSSVI